MKKETTLKLGVLLLISLFLLPLFSNFVFGYKGQECNPNNIISNCATGEKCVMDSTGVSSLAGFCEKSGSITQPTPTPPHLKTSKSDTDTKVPYEQLYLISKLFYDNPDPKNQWLPKWENAWFSGDTLDTKNGGIVKYFALLLVVLIIYSTLKYVDFPEGGISKIAIAIIIGLLSTFAITTNEIITLLNSYTALGVTVITIFPILILSFFTLVTIEKGKAGGLFFSRIIWLVYGGYLLIKAAIPWLIKFFGNWGYTQDSTGKVTELSGIFSGFITASDFQKIIESESNMMLFILTIVAIAILWIAIFHFKWIIEIVAREKLNAATEAATIRKEKSRAYEEANAKQIDKE